MGKSKQHRTVSAFGTIHWIRVIGCHTDWVCGILRQNFNSWIQLARDRNNQNEQMSVQNSFDSMHTNGHAHLQ